MSMHIERYIKFSELTFKNHPILHPMFAGKQAIAFFKNGYGVSIVTYLEPDPYDQTLYEIAVLKGNKDRWKINCNVDNCQEIIAYITEKEVDEIMLEVQSRICD